MTYYHHDQLGSTTLLTSATGAKVATYTYDSYGLIAKTTGTSTNPLLFAGQYRNTESGLYYLQVRYYDPSTGQFISVDPALSVTGQPYSYAGGNPVNAVDPTGDLAFTDWLKTQTKIGQSTLTISLDWAPATVPTSRKQVHILAFWEITRNECQIRRKLLRL